MPDIKQIQHNVIEKLQKGLPDYLTYHNISHTLDVLEQAMVLAREEGITNKEDLLLLQVSALYHDTGFIKEYSGHEEESCVIAKKDLPNYGFCDKQIEKICSMIRATKIPQNPTTILEEIICDADLDYLGRPDFYQIGNGLYSEFLYQGVVTNEQDWNMLQVRFLEKHRYFTKSSKKKRDKAKQKHLAEVRQKVELVN